MCSSPIVMYSVCELELNLCKVANKIKGSYWHPSLNLHKFYKVRICYLLGVLQNESQTWQY